MDIDSLIQYFKDKPDHYWVVLIVPTVLIIPLKSSIRESDSTQGPNVIKYSATSKAFTIIMWVVVIGLIGIIYQKKGLSDVKSMICLMLLFAGLMIPLALEVFCTRIEWDQGHIYTRSPWRRKRKIPVSSIRKCDFSESMQWYRIHTRGYGIIRLPMLTKGIPNLFKVLSFLRIPHPSYPPEKAWRPPYSG